MRRPVGPEAAARTVLDGVTAHHGVRYHAPDIAAVDQHLTGLSERVTWARQDGRRALADALLDDIDLLLDRRSYYMTVG